MTSLDRLEALEKEATEGPWKTQRWPHRATEFIGPADPERPGYRLLVKPAQDFEFIAALRNAAPALIAVANWAQTMLSAEVVSTSEFMALQEEGHAALAALDEALT